MKSVDDVRVFLELTTYYRRFVENYAKISKPLVKLLEKDVEFQWSPECNSAFMELKRRLTEAPILAYPRFNKPFILDTDASAFAIGSVLSQVGNDGLEHPVAYFSRILSKPECNYSVTRKELLSMIDSMEHFRTYLLGKPFTVRTDHTALRWLQNFKEPTNQVARWIERLAEFDYTVQHRPGKSHGNADALSRYPVQAIAIAGTPECCEFSLPDLAESQSEDKILGKIREWVKEGKRPTDGEVAASSAEERFYWAKFSLLECKNDVLYITHATDDENADGKKRLVSPKSMYLLALQYTHSKPGSGHLSTKKMYEKLRLRFYWWRMYETIQSFVHACEACASRKSFRKNRAPLKPIGTVWPFQ